MTRSNECHLCSARLSSRSALNSHYYSKHAASHCCYFCSKQFTTERTLNVHFDEEHKTSDQLMCIFACGERVAGISELMKHLKIEHEEEFIRMKCEHCDYVAFSPTSLENHCRCYVHKTASHVELSADGGSRKGKKRKRQDSSATGYTEHFICTICEGHSKYRQNMKKHVLNIHKVKVDKHMQFTRVVRVPPKGDSTSEDSTYTDEASDCELVERSVRRAEMVSSGSQADLDCSECDKSRQTLQELEESVARIKKYSEKIVNSVD